MPTTIKWGQDKEKIYLTFHFGRSIGIKDIKEMTYSFDENGAFVFEINEDKFCLPFYNEINIEEAVNITDTENSKRFVFTKKESHKFWKQLLKEKSLYNNLISVDWSKWQDEDSSEDEADVAPFELGDEGGMNTDYLNMMQNMSPEQLQQMMGNLQDCDEQEDKEEQENEDDQKDNLDIPVPNDIDPEKLKEIMESIKGSVPDNTEGIRSMLEKMGASSMPGMPGCDGTSDIPGIPNLNDLPNLDSIN